MGYAGEETPGAGEMSAAGRRSVEDASERCERAMRMSEPGATPDARSGQPYERGGSGAADGRAGLNGQRAWNDAPPAPEAPLTPYTALAETQPRLATPPALRAMRRARDMDPGDGEDTRKRKRVTDSARMPALRLNRRDRAPRAERKPRMVYDTERAPGYLRPVRLVVGLGALGAAWGMALVVTSLASDLWAVAAHQRILTERFVLYLMDAVGISWLAVIGLALIVVGAFALFLGLVRREW
jgi:hypothetical protein